MSERPNVAVPAAIQEAQLEFENWRRDRKRGERIPGNLWAVLRKKYIRRSGIPFFTPQFSPAGIRDAGHQELMSPRLGDLLEYVWVCGHEQCVMKSGCRF